MKFLKFILITFTLSLFYVSVSAVDAQDNGDGRQFSKLFDAKTVETLKGDITLIVKRLHEKGPGYGLGFKMKTDDETIFVHVGPGWYVEEKDFTFKEGDKIEVTGSRVTYKDNQIIIAMEIIKDGKTLILRNAEGTPLWIGWGDN